MATKKWLLTQNSQMRKEGIFNWTLPAMAASLPDGRNILVCPNAGACAALCYARVGAYRFSNVKAAHVRNLMMTLDSLEAWEQQMSEELQHKRYANRWIRLHDSGDFHSREYLAAWLRIMRRAPESVTFYCYTKEVSKFREMVEPDPPRRFKWCYSLGGKEDHLLDLDNERHAEVFPGEQEIIEAGYSSQTASDLLSVTGPRLVGIPSNPIPHLQRKQGQETFGSLQRKLDTQLAAKKQRTRSTQPSSKDGAALDVDDQP